MSSDNPEPFTRWFGSPSPSRTQPSLRPFDLSSQTRDQEIPRYVQASPESTTSRQASPQSNEDMQFTNTFPLNNGPLAFHGSESAMPSRVSFIARSRSGTPIVSVTPPVNDSRPTPQSRPTTATGSFQLDGMREALVEAERLPVPRTTSLPPLSLSPSTQHQRRRSSSHVNVIPYLVEDEDPPEATKGNNGAACTCAATEYHYHDRGDFRVEVVLLSQSEIDEQTFELLRAYRQYHLQFTSGGQSNGLEPDNVAVEPTAAINTFQAMFRGQLEDPSCLLRPNEGAVQTTLRQWAIQARPSHHEGVTTCETLQHCSQFLENLSSETVGSQDPAVWPYIKRIRASKSAADLLIYQNIRAEETKRGRPDLADDIQQHVDNIVNLESKIDEANDSADECENIDDPSYSDIRRGRELRRKIQKLSSYLARLSTFLIESRNRQVIEQLRSQYSSSVPNGDLEVHCVSNTLYSDKRDKTRDEALPFINLSGIPALRRHCIGLVADAQSREVLNYIQKDIPALISELDIWVQNGAGTLDAERRRDIREVVNAVEHGIQSALNKNSSRIRTISSLANATFESKVYKVTYKMFCGNFGYHSTPKQAVQSWNHQAMHAMTLDLSTRWRDFKFQLEGHHARVLDTVNSVQADAVQKIDDELSEFPAFISTVLGEVVSRRIQLLAEDIERHYTTLLEDLW
ncbi:conserved hypothetical protein [Verticillium alfalfae VaMs.102]|uniref:DUF7605 domain-containing protein n=1 Tax=Verticillium alfalfae (strain VaMs.102 / ATCC MYA-4576 / FGSC 10136) TaxID=526221 RepID=C9SDW3_VERA1|nr:conserved hypothetical protein [Verticillium alfalfae VaMs.102]EEY16449.1 conserved hypothetical protein [Verticillium alfalfae VaMs.102]